MNEPRYETTKLDDDSYRFYSEGPKGRIEKRIVFQHMWGNEYNLAFGDWNKSMKDIDDQIRTKNNDIDTVLITVAYQFLDFIESNPDALVYAKGSDEARTRKYQMGISKNINFLNDHFVIRGFIAKRGKNEKFIDQNWFRWKGEWHTFTLGTNYDIFLLYSKGNDKFGNNKPLL